MDNKIFREKSVERITSPEQLNDYIKVANPSVWLVLVGIIVLLAGMCVWGIFGKIETKITTAVLSSENTATIFVKESDIDKIQSGMTVRVGETELIIDAISSQLMQIDEQFVADYHLDDLALHMAGLHRGDFVFVATAPCTLENGVYSAEIVTESMNPMSFIFN